MSKSPGLPPGRGLESVPTASSAWGLAQLRSGYGQVRAVTRYHARSFYFASFALCHTLRRAAFAIYGFCRRLDDWVDVAGEALPTQQRLQAARRLVASLFARAASGSASASVAAEIWELSQHSPWPAAELLAFYDTAQRYGLAPQPFLDLIDGMEMDLRGQVYQTFDDLQLYCYRVAGTVGLMMLPVLGYRDETAVPAARLLGEAMQLTNILRDVGEDAARGRCYLPAQELAAFGLRPSDVFRGQLDGRMVEFLQFQIARARAQYTQASASIALLRTARCRVMVRLMAEIYGGILQAIENNNYDVFKLRAMVPLRQKLFAAAAIVWRGRSRWERMQ